MKTKVLSFFKNYYLCIVLSVMLFVAFAFSLVFNDFLFPFVFFGIPLYSLIYGAVFCLIKRKIWISQLILYLVNFALLWALNVFRLETLPFALLLPIYPVIFSLFGAFIVFAAHCIKEGMK